MVDLGSSINDITQYWSFLTPDIVRLCNIRYSLPPKAVTSFMDDYLKKIKGHFIKLFSKCVLQQLWFQRCIILSFLIIWLKIVALTLHFSYITMQLDLNFGGLKHGEIRTHDFSTNVIPTFMRDPHA